MRRLIELHNRRVFCKRLASVATGASGAVLLQSCGGNLAGSISGSPLPTVNGTLSGAGVTVPISAGSPLAATNGMALVTSSAGDFLVTRASATTFIAVTAQCTHQACVITDSTGQSFVCPCHGSEFDTSGHVIVGPAIAPLRQFTTQFTNNVLTIS